MTLERRSQLHTKLLNAVCDADRACKIIEPLIADGHLRDDAAVSLSIANALRTIASDVVMELIDMEEKERRGEA